jgi:hypothetical protein
MRAVAAGKESQALKGRKVSRNYGIAQALLKPADRTGADASHHHAGKPSLSKNRIQTPVPPQNDQVTRVAAADIDNILFQNEGAQVGSRRFEEG